ncbi:carbon storage regulator [Vibrio kyushuensis]|uniref:carbon storage regulator n=1 Tax=Vibrio TaxID=662 RepID=UPI003D0D6A77
MRLALFVICTITLLPATADELLLTDATLSSTELSDSRGGQYYVDIDSVVASSDIHGISSGNSADYSTTGSNIIASGALLDSSGITNVIQNSGNNVLIQNATIVNLSLE